MIKRFTKELIIAIFKGTETGIPGKELYKKYDCMEVVKARLLKSLEE